MSNSQAGGVLNATPSDGGTSTNIKNQEASTSTCASRNENNKAQSTVNSRSNRRS